jgi:dihydroorotase-like cyclic amidohydrolase
VFLPDAIVRSRRVLTPGGVRPAAIHIRQGKILGIVAFDDVPTGCGVDDLGDAAILPGMHALDVDRWGTPAPSLAEPGLRIVMPALSGSGGALLVEASAADADAIALLSRLSREYRTATHLVRVSSSETLTPLFRARQERAPITASASARSLCVVSTTREREHREFLWAALANGLIQFVAADAGSPLDVAGLWREASARGYSMDQLASWTASMPAHVMGCARHGKIDVGFDADLVAIDDEAVVRVYARGERIS